MTTIEIIAGCARRVQVQCIERFGMLHVPYTDSSRRAFQGPPVVCTDVQDTNISNLPRSLYDSPDVTLDHVAGAWDLTIQHLLNGKSGRLVRGVLQATFPRMEFDLVVRDALVQFLVAASWGGEGRLEAVKPHQVLLHLGEATIGLDGNWILHGAGARHRRFGALGPVTFRGMKARVGSPRTSTAQVGALHDHLAARMPEIAYDIDILCSAAVWDGRDAEEQLAAPFDLERMDVDGARGVTIWNMARMFVVDEGTNPLPALAKLLTPRLSSRAFSKAFGNPYRATRNVGPVVRQRLLKTIDRLEQLERGAPLVDPSQDVTTLLQMQDIIGRAAS